MARITPRITPYVPKPQYFTPGHLIRSAPRAIATGNVPHPRIRIPHVAVPKIRATATTSNLTKQSSSGTRVRNIPSKPPSRKSNRAPKTPKVQVVPVRAGAVKIPNSFHHQQTPTGPKLPKPAMVKRQIKSVFKPAKIKFPNI